MRPVGASRVFHRPFFSKSMVVWGDPVKLGNVGQGEGFGGGELGEGRGGWGWF